MIFLAIKVTTAYASYDGTPDTDVEIGLLEADSKEAARGQLGEPGTWGRDRWKILAPGEFTRFNISGS